MPEVAVFDRLGVRPEDADLTVVQFSTAFCGPCRATKARLQQLQATRPGLAVVQVDAESHLDEVRELDVRRTPTLFYLDRDGAADRAQQRRAAAGRADRSGRCACRGAVVIGYSRAVGTLLTSRRTVDLCRVGSCLCPTS